MPKHRIPIPSHLRVRMIEVARDFRKTPTASEAILWQALRGSRLGAKFRRQHPIGPFVVDFYCANANLIVEVDGPIHKTQREHDSARQELLELCGYRVLRVAADDVERYLGVVLASIADVSQSRVVARD
jgi:very-short-patch-repair endonuclease